MNDGIIVLKDPSSISNQFKRIGSILFGSLLIVISLIVYNQNNSINFDGIRNAIILVPVFAIILIYYGIQRNKIHKSCYIKFSKGNIEGRIPVQLSSYKFASGHIFEILLRPKFREFNFSTKEIDKINVETNTILIFHKTGENFKIDLSTLDYEKVKEIKTKFITISSKLS